MRLRVLTGTASAPLLATIAFAGCGGSSTNGVASKAPAAILAATKAAADGASSVHVSGSIVSSGNPITFDLALLAGKGGRGRLSENGLGFEVIRIGATAYINGSPAFYRHFGGGAAAALLQGKWLKAPARSGNFASLTAFTDLRQLLATTLAHHGTLAKGATTTVNGQRVVGVTDTSRGGTLYVATTGKPYPIEIAGGGANTGKLTFDHWNESVSLTPPPNAVDITQLKSGH